MTEKLADRTVRVSVPIEKSLLVRFEDYATKNDMNLTQAIKHVLETHLQCPVLGVSLQEEPAPCA